MTDDEIDIEASESNMDEDDLTQENFDEQADSSESSFLQMKKGNRANNSGGGNICSSGSCPQGKQKSVTKSDCHTSLPVDTTNFITSLDVNIASQNIHVTWSSGHTEDWACSPNPSHTPRGTNVVGVKCSINHTNRHKDGMAWFTSFDSQGLRIGFHNSQRVGAGIVSHGCVRVCCDKANIINRNTWSGRTTINVV